MKNILTTYTFTPGTANVGSVTLTGVNVPLSQILLITNATRGIILYNFASATTGAFSYTQSTNSILVFNTDTSTHNSQDKLTIFYEDGVNVTTTTINGKNRMDVSLAGGHATGSIINGYGNLVGGSDGLAFRPISTDSSGSVMVGNSPTLFNDGLNILDPSNWNTVVTASGDLIIPDGNTVNSSYLAFSLDPTADDTESYIETVETFKAPTRISLLYSTSQRTLGQDMSFEWVSTEEPTTSGSNVEISTISQTGTLLSVTASSAHNYRPGDRISIVSCADSRMNYSNLIVSSIQNTASFVCTSTSNTTITSGNFSAQSGSSAGMVMQRPSMKFAPNGTALVLDTPTVTEGTFFARAGGLGTFPSGVIAGAQKVTIATTISTNPVANVAGCYSFAPSSITELLHNTDHFEWLDKPIDSFAVGYTTRFRKDQVVPDPSKNYKLRIRLRNNPSVTRVTSKIISCSKAGSTTSTVTHDGSVTYRTTDFVQLHGRRDYATNFPNMAAAVQIASIVSPTQFTIVDGAASTTATTYGGSITRVNGQQVLQGVLAPVIQNVVRGVDGNLIVTGGVTWSGVCLVGDYVNVFGCRANTDGSDVGVDGSYRVREILTTSLILESIGSTPSGVISSTACGGICIRRTDLRVGAIRISPYIRHIVESSGGLTKLDQASAAPVYLTGGANLSISSLPTLNSVTAVGTLTTVSTVNSIGSVTSSNASIPGLISDQASAAITSTTVGGTIVPTFGSAYTMDVSVTATSGTSQTYDIIIQESGDGGTGWYDRYHMQRINAIGYYRTPPIQLLGNRIRYIQVISGSTPSFTRVINRLQSSSPTSVGYQYYERNGSVISGSAGATSSVFVIDGCSSLGAKIAIGSAITPATYQLQTSEDSIIWGNVGASVVATASAAATITANNVWSRFARVVVSGSGAVNQTGSYITINARQ